MDENINFKFLKCGEIKTSWVEGKGNFYLICDFCDYIALQLEIFVNHVNTEHKDVHKINSSKVSLIKFVLHRYANKVTFLNRKLKILWKCALILMTKYQILQLILVCQRFL